MDTAAPSAFASATPARERHSVLKTIDSLLRDRSAIYERIRTDDDLLGLSRAMIATIVAGAAVSGAAVGAYRGGVIQTPTTCLSLLECPAQLAQRVPLQPSSTKEQIEIIIVLFGSIGIVFFATGSEDAIVTKSSVDFGAEFCV